MSTSPPMRNFEIVPSPSIREFLGYANQVITPDPEAFASLVSLTECPLPDSPRLHYLNKEDGRDQMTADLLTPRVAIHFYPDNPDIHVLLPWAGAIGDKELVLNATAQVLANRRRMDQSKKLIRRGAGLAVTGGLVSVGGGTAWGNTWGTAGGVIFAAGIGMAGYGANRNQRAAAPDVTGHPAILTLGPAPQS